MKAVDFVTPVTEQPEEWKTTYAKTMLNQLLKKGILLEKEEKKQAKTKGDNFLKLAGIVTAKEPFSATEEVKKLRNGEL